MNTIGVRKGNVDMSLDEIIRNEPYKYTSVLTNNYTSTGRPKPGGGINQGWKSHQQANRVKRGNIKKNRPKFRHGYYQKQKRNQRNHKNTNDGGYGNQSFMYNGVGVCTSSPLLCHGAGVVEVLNEPKGHKNINEHVQYPKKKPFAAAPRMRYSDMNYVRLPVHERLGWAFLQRRQFFANQYRKSRVHLAAKFLRRRDRYQNFRVHVVEKSFPEESDFDSEPTAGMPVFQDHDRANRSTHQSHGQAIGNSNGDRAFVAPLSLQNVAQLPGSKRDGGATARCDFDTESVVSLQSVKDLEASYKQELQNMQRYHQMQLMSVMNIAMNPAMMGGHVMPMGGVGMPLMSFMQPAGLPTLHNSAESGQSSMSPLVPRRALSNSVPVFDPTLHQAANQQPLNVHVQSAMAALQRERGGSDRQPGSLEFKPRAQATRQSMDDRFFNLSQV